MENGLKNEVTVLPVIDETGRALGLINCTTSSKQDLRPQKELGAYRPAYRNRE